MKIEKENTEFNPIKIVVESKDELEMLLACLNHSKDSYEKSCAGMGVKYKAEMNEKRMELWNELEDIREGV